MATFSEIVQRVITKYKGSNASAFTTQAEYAVNDAIDFYKNYEFWFTQGLASVTLTASDPDLTSASGFPTDYNYIHPSGGIAIVDSQNRYTLKRISIEEYNAINTQATGRPYAYSEFDEVINVYFYPQQAYVAEFRYVKKYTELSGSESNDFTNNAYRLLEAHALQRLFLSEGHDGTDMRKFWQEEEQRQLFTLLETNRMKTTTGELATDELYNN